MESPPTPLKGELESILKAAGKLIVEQEIFT
jgi:hypothetical protein